ncbi:Uncharacterised protein [uncultured archaeon]|nr:Uncharacterised protein [uncultured archaeon]
MSGRPFYQVVAGMLAQEPEQRVFRSDLRGFQDFFYQQKRTGNPVLTEVRFGDYFGPVSREVVGGFLLLNAYGGISVDFPRFDLCRVNPEVVKNIQEESIRSRTFTQVELPFFPRLAREFFERF